MKFSKLLTIILTIQTIVTYAQKQTILTEGFQNINNWQIINGNWHTTNNWLTDTNSIKSSGDTIVYQTPILNINEQELTIHFILSHHYKASTSNYWHIILTDTKDIKNGIGIGTGLDSIKNNITFFRIKNKKRIVVYQTNIEVNKEDTITINATRTTKGQWIVCDSINFNDSTLIDFEINYAAIKFCYTKTAANTFFIDTLAITCKEEPNQENATQEEDQEENQELDQSNTPSPFNTQLDGKLFEIETNNFCPQKETIVFKIHENDNKIINFIDIFNERGKIRKQIQITDHTNIQTKIEWDGLDNNGTICTPGIYIVLVTYTNTTTHKISKTKHIVIITPQN